MMTNFHIFDADNHYYETQDAFTRYLPKHLEGLFKYVEVNGRTKLAINNYISDYIPNPTFEVVAPPGLFEIKYRLENPNSTMSPDEIKDLEMPPKYMKSIPAFFEPEPRIELMDELGVDRSIMWPTLATLLEERLADDPIATHEAAHAFNEWLLDQWDFVYKDRIFSTPIIALNIVEKAIEELEWALKRGAKVVLVRPAPVPDFNGRRRSFALPEFDAFWARVQEADILVGMHEGDNGFQNYLNNYEGHTREFLPFETGISAFTKLINSESRPISDVIASIVGHGLVTRFPKLKFLPVENGSSWVRPLLDKFKLCYGRSPSYFLEDPVEAFNRCIWIHPFHEEDTVGLAKELGADRITFGSDYPHPEGLDKPTEFVKELRGLSEDDQRKIMGGNLSALMDAA